MIADTPISRASRQFTLVRQDAFQLRSRIALLEAWLDDAQLPRLSSDVRAVQMAAWEVAARLHLLHQRFHEPGLERVPRTPIHWEPPTEEDAR